jgi:hypothetical protein
MKKPRPQPGLNHLWTTPDYCATVVLLAIDRVGHFRRSSLLRRLQAIRLGPRNGPRGPKQLHADKSRLRENLGSTTERFVEARASPPVLFFAIRNR